MISLTKLFSKDELHAAIARANVAEQKVKEMMQKHTDQLESVMQKYTETCDCVKQLETDVMELQKQLDEKILNEKQLLEKLFVLREYVSDLLNGR